MIYGDSRMVPFAQKGRCLCACHDLKVWPVAHNGFHRSRVAYSVANFEEDSLCEVPSLHCKDGDVLTRSKKGNCLKIQRN